MRRSFDIFKNSAGQFQAVKHGFSWPGFFFHWIWALVSRLWLIGIIFLVLDLALTLLWLELSSRIVFVVVLGRLAIHTTVGLKGNSWKAHALENRGYLRL